MTPVEQVKARAGCEARGLGQCGDPLGTGLQVHELGRGVWRKHCRNYTEAMLLLCPQHHEWVTRNPVQARAVGLAWGPDAQAKLAELGWTSKAVTW